MLLGLIWAQNLKNGIGFKNKIPWNVPEDLKHFKKITENSAVIMGRKTWESIPKNFKPLKDRVNIVISSSNNIDRADKVFSNPELSLEYAKNLNKDIWIIGGSSIYAEFIELANVLEVTYVFDDSKADVFAPNINQLVWKNIEKSEKKVSKTGISYQFMKFIKI